MTPHPQRCEHYPICYYVRDRKENKISECYLCIADDPYLKMVCGLDTRSHSFAPTEQDERDKVLDEGNILDSFCRIGLYWYIKGDEESDDVGKCRGKDCNYCGRYSEELRTAAKEQE